MGAHALPTLASPTHLRSPLIPTPAPQAELPSIIDRYREYKANIPVYGAILLDAALERVLLVCVEWAWAVGVGLGVHVGTEGGCGHGMGRGCGSRGAGMGCGC